jgi:hypothetical protein
MFHDTGLARLTKDYLLAAIGCVDNVGADIGGEFVID